MTRIAGPAVLAVLLAAVVMAAPPERDPASLIARVRAVGAEGKGNDDASAAWKQLVGLGTDALLPTLAAITDSDPVANNWLRSAVDAVAEKALQEKRSLPVKELESFVKD